MFRLCCVAFSALLIALATPVQSESVDGCETDGPLTAGVTSVETSSPMPGYLTINVTTAHADGTWMAIGISFTPNMLNADMVIAAQNPDNLTQYFVEDRWVGAPRTPPVYDTQQDLTDVSFSRENGITTIEFTRKLNTGDATQDIALDTATPVYIIWAFGGAVTNYVSPATIGQHTPTTRGVFAGAFTFTECALNDGECQGSLTAGVNNVEWFSPMDGYLTITASTTHVDDTWMAIGISFTNNMLNADIVIAGQNPNNLTQYFVEDRWVGASRIRPTYDAEQDLTDVSFSRDNGITTIKFTRKLNTGNTQDIALDTANSEVYFIWAFGGSVSSYDTPAVFAQHTNRGPFGTDTFSFTECALDNGDGAGTVMISFVSLIIAAVAAISFF